MTEKIVNLQGKIQQTFQKRLQRLNSQEVWTGIIQGLNNLNTMSKLHALFGSTTGLLMLIIIIIICLIVVRRQAKATRHTTLQQAAVFSLMLHKLQNKKGEM